MEDLIKLIGTPGLGAAAQLGALLMARLLPIIVMTPVFGGQSLPRRMRLGIALFLALALLPVFQPRLDQAPLLPAGQFFALVGKEAAVGLTLALMVLVLFETIASTGALVDLARGATIANVFDPLSQNQQSLLSAFYTQLTTVLFFSIGGIQMLMRTLGESYVMIRPYDFLPGGLFGPDSAEHAIGLVAELFLLTFRLAAPAVVILLLVDFALGCINRVAPQIQVTFLGGTVKGLLGLIVVFAAFGLFIDAIVEMFGRMLRALLEWSAAAGAR